MRPTPPRCSATSGVRRAHVAGHSTGAAIGLQLAVDRPDVVHTLALLEPTLPGIPSAGAFFAKAGPALAAYGAGDREGAMAEFLSVVCSLDWETCRTVIEQHVPGGVAQAMTGRRHLVRQLCAGPERVAVRARAGGRHLPAGAVGAGHGDRAVVRGGPRSCCTAGSRRLRTARLRGSPTCCTCSGRSPSRRAWPRSSRATP